MFSDGANQPPKSRYKMSWEYYPSTEFKSKFNENRNYENIFFKINRSSENDNNCSRNYLKKNGSSESINNYMNRCFETNRSNENDNILERNISSKIDNNYWNSHLERNTSSESNNYRNRCFETNISNENDNYRNKWLEETKIPLKDVKLIDHLKKERCYNFLNKKCFSKCSFLHKFPKEDGIICMSYYFQGNCRKSICNFLHTGRCCKEDLNTYYDKWKYQRCRYFIRGKCDNKLCKKYHRFPKQEGLYCIEQAQSTCLRGYNCIYLHKDNLNSLPNDEPGKINISQSETNRIKENHNYRKNVLGRKRNNEGDNIYKNKCLDEMKISLKNAKLFDSLKKERCGKFLEGKCFSNCSFLHKLPKEDGIICWSYYFYENCRAKICNFLHTVRCCKEDLNTYYDQWKSQRCSNFIYGECDNKDCIKNHKFPKEDGLYCIKQAKSKCLRGSNCFYLHKDNLNSLPNDQQGKININQSETKHFLYRGNSISIPVREILKNDKLPQHKERTHGVTVLEYSQSKKVNPNNNLDLNSSQSKIEDKLMSDEKIASDVVKEGVGNIRTDSTGEDSHFHNKPIETEYENLSNAVSDIGDDYTNDFEDCDLRSIEENNINFNDESAKTKVIVTPVSDITSKSSGECILGTNAQIPRKIRLNAKDLNSNELNSVSGKKPIIVTAETKNEVKKYAKILNTKNNSPLNKDIGQSHEWLLVNKQYPEAPKSTDNKNRKDHSESSDIFKKSENGKNSFQQNALNSVSLTLSSIQKRENDVKTSIENSQGSNMKIDEVIDLGFNIKGNPKLDSPKLNENNEKIIINMNSSNIEEQSLVNTVMGSKRVISTIPRNNLEMELYKCFINEGKLNDVVKVSVNKEMKTNSDKDTSSETTVKQNTTTKYGANLSDILLKISDIKIESTNDFTQAIEAHPPSTSSSFIKNHDNELIIIKSDPYQFLPNDVTDREEELFDNFDIYCLNCNSNIYEMKKSEPILKDMETYENNEYTIQNSHVKQLSNTHENNLLLNLKSESESSEQELVNENENISPEKKTFSTESPERDINGKCLLKLKLNHEDEKISVEKEPWKSDLNGKCSSERNLSKVKEELLPNLKDKSLSTNKHSKEKHSLKRKLKEKNVHLSYKKVRSSSKAPKITSNENDSSIQKSRRAKSNKRNFFENCLSKEKLRGVDENITSDKAKFSSDSTTNNFDNNCLSKQISDTNECISFKKDSSSSKTMKTNSNEDCSSKQKLNNTQGNVSLKLNNEYKNLSSKEKGSSFDYSKHNSKEICSSKRKLNNAHENVSSDVDESSSDSSEYNFNENVKSKGKTIINFIFPTRNSRRPSKQKLNNRIASLEKEGNSSDSSDLHSNEVGLLKQKWSNDDKNVRPNDSLDYTKNNFKKSSTLKRKIKNSDGKLTKKRKSLKSEFTEDESQSPSKLNESPSSNEMEESLSHSNKKDDSSSPSNDLGTLNLFLNLAVDSANSNLNRTHYSSNTTKQNKGACRKDRKYSIDSSNFCSHNGIRSISISIE